MNDIEVLSMVNNFPVGSIPKNRAELLSKAEIISFLARFQEQFSTIENVDERELVVRTFLGKLLKLEEGEVLPSLDQAEIILKLTPGFVQDFDKVQYIKENNYDFDVIYNLIASNLELNEEVKKNNLKGK